MALTKETTAQIAAFVKEKQRATTDEIAAHVIMKDQKRSLVANLLTMESRGVLVSEWGNFGARGGRCQAWTIGLNAQPLD